MENLEREPADLLPLSISHQKERTGVPLEQNAERHLWILPLFLLLVDWDSWAAMPSLLVPPVICPLTPQSPLGCGSCSSALLPCCWAMQSFSEIQHIPPVTPVRSYPLMSNSV